MKRHSGPPKKFAPTLRRHESVKLVVAISLVLGAAFAACGIDDSNSPLKNEAPNHGKFVGGIAIGAGPGTGGSGAGLGSGGSTNTSAGGGGGVPIPSDCTCGSSYVTDADECRTCATALCGSDITECEADSNCPTELANFQSCQNAVCIATAIDKGSALFLAILNCACSQCPSGMTACIQTSIPCQ